MATVTKPIALDESLNTTELSSRNVADVLAQELSAVATAIGGITHPDAEDIVYDNSGSGLSATDVQNAIDELSSEKADSSSLATVATSGDYDDLINKPTIPTVNDATLTIQKNGSDVATFTANASSNVTANVTVPTTTSELTNNSDFVSDASYVHTDNNFTTTLKDKLDGIESGAEVNVQSDWSQSDNTADDYIKNKPSSEVKSATDTFTTVNGGLLSKCVIDLEPIQSGSGDPAPDNVRPISGHTKVEVQNHQKNLFNQYGTSTITNPAGSSRDGVYIKLKAGTYTVSLGSDSPYKLYGRYKENSANTWSVADGDIGNSSTFTLATDGQICFYCGSGNLCSGLVQPMLEESPIKTAYVPYNGYQVTVQIGSTVYGGSLDIVSGSGEDAYTNIASYNGETINEPWISSMDVYTEGGTPTTGAQVVYPKTTATAISTTPQQIEALVGQNNLSCPLDGQSIQTNGVEYREVFVFDDVEKVVSLRVPISMLGTDESGRTTASQAYASGDYFYKDGYMCKALTSISAGATLTLNTNYSQGTLADVLKAIENT